MEPGNNHIIISNISRTFGSVKALNDVSFEVKPGELFGLIGPDGAGKTTLLRIITTLLLPDRGSVKIGKFDSVNDYKALRRILGYMPGRFSLYHDLSIEENLNFYATIFNRKFDPDFELIREIYAQLAPFKNRLAGKLSGGMKQKLALCCALIHKPEILILDEPTTGVDALSRSEFWKMLNGLKREGITTMVSTPYMDEATQCDRVVLMQNGSVLRIDSPGNIVDSFFRKIITIRTLDNYKIIRFLRGHQGTHAVYPFGQNIHYIPEKSFTTPDTLKEILAKAGFENCLIKEGNANIEDCFMELMYHDTAS